MTTQLSVTAQKLLTEWDNLIYGNDDLDFGQVEILMDEAKANGVITWDEYCAIELALGF